MAGNKHLQMNSLIHRILLVLAHNDNHHLTVEHGGYRYHVCTRCSGMLVGILAGLPFIFMLNLPALPGPPIAAASLLLFTPDFLYWALTRVRLVRDLPFLRFLTGVLLGFAVLGFGQARIEWGVKVLVAGLLFTLVILANPILGRKSTC
jgi:uncharacterized membrane protein